ncbi:MAG: hypothetical protein HY902_03740 [Deltaproteobacteria bacterium]|nr:hypothetical protein [Deltaproteobacteria bacterium]
MTMRNGTATEFLLGTLSNHSDREIQIAELFDLAGGKFTKMNLREALLRLHEKGFVTKVNDDDRSVWWSITADGLRAAQA